MSAVDVTGTTARRVSGATDPPGGDKDNRSSTVVALVSWVADADDLGGNSKGVLARGVAVGVENESKLMRSG